MNYLLWGSISGCLVVLIGAFGAHGLKDILDDYSKSIYDKAVLYQMFHTLIILILGIANKINPEIQFHLSAWAFLIGIIIFSGSLYILAISGFKTLGMITPIGGLFFIIGWVLLIIKAL